MAKTISIPTSQNFEELLKDAAKTDSVFEYRIKPHSPNTFYIQPEIVDIILKTLKELPLKTKIELLEFVPDDMTTLTMVCLEQHSKTHEF